MDFEEDQYLIFQFSACQCVDCTACVQVYGVEPTEETISDGIQEQPPAEQRTEAQDVLGPKG